jgi:hypothetical protein
MKTSEESGGQAPRILNFGTRWCEVQYQQQWSDNTVLRGLQDSSTRLTTSSKTEWLAVPVSARSRLSLFRCFRDFAQFLQANSGIVGHDRFLHILYNSLIIIRPIVRRCLIWTTDSEVKQMNIKGSFAMARQVLEI